MKKKQTVADYPKLLKEWHPTLNGELNPHDISFRSAKQIWWICEKGHEWQRSCDNRRCGEVGCSYCTNRKVCNDNCLTTTHPEVAKEWHSTLNGKSTPNDTFIGTHKKYWWICDKGHEWKAACYSRVKRGCPYCANQKVCNDNCLTTLFPEVAKEWHPILNGKLTPNEITSGTHKKYWWICDKGHEWKAVCGSRTNKDKVGCPYCANKKVCKDNCLATLFPEVAKEWHPMLNGKLIPNDIAAGTPKKVWWQCSKGHDYKTSCCLRTYKKTGCPYCANKKVCKDNCLATLFPEVAKEWHPILNGRLKPNDVTSGTHKKYWWICDKGHEWKISSNGRTCKKTGCPICNESKGEKEVARILDELNITYKREFKFENCKNEKHLRFDFVIKANDKAKAIEYQGEQHYEPHNFGSSKTCKHENLKGIQKRDKIKRNFCKSANIPLLEISYKDFDKIEEQVKKFLSEE